MGKMARVLIVEDEEKMARMLARVLREEGHVAETAADGRTGLGRALGYTFEPGGPEEPCSNASGYASRWRTWASSRCSYWSWAVAVASFSRRVNAHQGGLLAQKAKGASASRWRSRTSFRFGATWSARGRSWPRCWTTPCATPPKGGPSSVSGRFLNGRAEASVTDTGPRISPQRLTQRESSAKTGRTGGYAADAGVAGRVLWALTIRYERRADIYEAFSHLGCWVICLNYLSWGFSTYDYGEKKNASAAMA